MHFKFSRSFAISWWKQKFNTPSSFYDKWVEMQYYCFLFTKWSYVLLSQQITCQLTNFQPSGDLRTGNRSQYPDVIIFGSSLRTPRWAAVDADQWSSKTCQGVPTLEQPSCQSSASRLPASSLPELSDSSRDALLEVMGLGDADWDDVGEQRGDPQRFTAGRNPPLRSICLKLVNLLQKKNTNVNNDIYEHPTTLWIYQKKKAKILLLKSPTWTFYVKRQKVLRPNG